MYLEINELGAIGVVKDTPAYQLPPEAWTLGENVHLVDGGVERVKGWSEVFPDSVIAPHFIMPLSTSSQTFWLYMGLTKGYVFDGSNHEDITRAVGGDYTATETRQINGTILGGVPILNNGADIPQFWAEPDVSTLLANLTNWPSTHRAKVIRAFGPYLVAFNVTISGTNYPHLVLWSHPADPGSVPISWDVTDPTKDTGQNDLADVNSGIILDALPLQSNMFIYKQGSIWRMRNVGGRFIFAFDTFLETVGLLSERCVATSADGLFHIAVTQDDIIIHNGNTVNSLLDGKMRRALFNNIDTTNFASSFLFVDPEYNEAWFCYPESGQPAPNRAIVIDYKNGGKPTEVTGIDFTNVAIGSVEGASEDGWEDDELGWEEDDAPWSEIVRRKLIATSPANSKFWQLNNGTTRDGATFNASLQRTALGITGQTRQGKPIVDFQQMKQITRVWPKLQGGPIELRIGSQLLVDGPLTWGPYVAFDAAIRQYADVIATGRALAIEFRSTAANDWRLDGYGLELIQRGKF